MTRLQERTARDKRMYDAGRRRERRRPRKSGSAIDVRPYNRHIAMRLTYYEASILDRLFTAIDEFGSPGRTRNGHVPTIFQHPEDKKAFRRLLRKANKAASLVQPQTQWEKQNEAAAQVLDRLS